jgi:NAD(P)-dependent dehydrogenase (short-subunit alcohol dehydrogenase family)
VQRTWAEGTAGLGVEAEPTNAGATSQDDVDRLVAAGDRVDVLANVAGIMDFFLQLGDVDDATWDRVLAVTPPVRRASPARSFR